MECSIKLRETWVQHSKMTARTKKWIRNTLKIIGGIMVIGAALLGLFSVRLIGDGVYPPDGNSSLGHVGMVVAGIIGCFVTLTGSLLGIWMFQKSRRFSGEEAG